MSALVQKLCPYVLFCLLNVLYLFFLFLQIDHEIFQTQSHVVASGTTTQKKNMKKGNKGQNGKKRISSLFSLPFLISLFSCISLLLPPLLQSLLSSLVSPRLLLSLLSSLTYAGGAEPIIAATVLSSTLSRNCRSIGDAGTTSTWVE